MTFVRRFTRAWRAAMTVALLALAVGAAPVHAASSVQVEVRPMVGGRYEIGGWLGVSVTLVNPGAATEGYLTAETASGLARRYVEMPAGARKVVTLYVEPEAFQRDVEVTYAEPGGSVSAKAEIRVLEQTSGQALIVGDPNGTLRPQILASGGDARSEPTSIAAADLPERPEPLRGMATIVWAADSSGLTDAQRSSLERWVADGGNLVVVGGADWQTRTAAFSEVLPLTNLAAVDGTAIDALTAFAGDAGAIDAGTVSDGTLRDDARAVVTADDGTILVSTRAFGAGRVTLVGADLATAEFRAWEASPRLWDRFAPVDMGLEQFFVGMPVREETLNSMSQALSTLPTLQLPPAEVLLAVIVGYILLIGPISYIVLRRMDRRELAWVTAPILIILFSACSYGIGRSIKGSDVVVNQIGVVRTSGTGAALAETYFGIFSPDRSTYAVSVDADALLGTLTSSGGFDGFQRPAGNAVIDQGRPARLSELSIGAFGFAGVQASAIVEASAALEVSWSVNDGDMIGTVTNVSDEPIGDVAYISTAGGKRIGDLAPGGSIEFTLPGANFNGSSASDQVYGFGGFDRQTESQRQMAQRRQVIDALVGYGGWGGMDTTMSVGRGPYIIGWREAAGPLAVEVEGLTATHYDSVVEVVSVQPSIGTGKVSVAPHRMSVALIETEGDVNQFDPSSVMIGAGTATFRIALPLEAVGIDAESLRVIVGPDVSVVMPGNDMFGGGFWPAGYVVEARNAAGGEWVELGDLSLDNTFDIADPAAMLGPAGIIDVRITGVDAPEFGQTQVFVSAAVTGVLDR